MSALIHKRMVVLGSVVVPAATMMATGLDVGHYQHLVYCACALCLQVEAAACCPGHGPVC